MCYIRVRIQFLYGENKWEFYFWKLTVVLLSGLRLFFWAVRQPISGIISYGQCSCVICSFVVLKYSLSWWDDRESLQCSSVCTACDSDSHKLICPKVCHVWSYSDKETDNFNATSLPLSLSGVLSTILVVLSMIIMLWLYIWLYIASNLNQVPTHYGHVIMCQNAVYWFSATKVEYCGC